MGRKTANVVLNTAFGEPTIAVDTHIFRVSNRTGLAPGKDVRTVEDKLVRLVPVEFKRDAHHWLILHGRYTCKARKPDCAHCVIHDLCRWPGKVPFIETDQFIGAFWCPTVGVVDSLRAGTIMREKALVEKLGLAKPT